MVKHNPVTQKTIQGLVYIRLTEGPKALKHHRLLWEYRRENGRNWSVKRWCSWKEGDTDDNIYTWQTSNMHIVSEVESLLSNKSYDTIVAEIREAGPKGTQLSFSFDKGEKK